MKVLVLGILITYCSIGGATTYEVYPSESPDAIVLQFSRCADGDTLLIHEGTYKIEGWTIDIRIHVMGIGSPTLESTSGNGIVTIQRDSVSISGLKFKGVLTNYLTE
jgi:hypothetical protein